MHPTRRLIACALIAAAAVFGSACSPEALTLFEQFTNSRPSDCADAIEQVWPDHLQPRAHRIMWRESRNTPTAQNRRSTAAGCFQILRMHSDRFAKLGFNWSTDRYDPWVNTAVAYDLYRTAGWSPWA